MSANHHRLQGGIMDNVDLELIIRQTLARLSQKRSGAKPLVFVTISPSISRVSWADGALATFVRQFLYEALLRSDADTAVEVMLRRRSTLRDMNHFVGIYPSYWVQLRVSGRGLKRNEQLIGEILSTVGYRAEEWVGVDNSDARLGIFGAKRDDAAKMVFYVERTKRTVKCDLLLPIREQGPVALTSERTDGNEIIVG
jgi:hypothetical protein